MRVLTGNEARKSRLALAVGYALLLWIQLNPLKLLRRAPHATGILAQNGEGGFIRAVIRAFGERIMGRQKGKVERLGKLGRPTALPLETARLVRNPSAAEAKRPRGLAAQKKRRSEAGATHYRLFFDN